MAADANVVVSLVTVQAIIVAILQWCKAKTWIPFIQKNGGMINRVFAMAAAGIGALGIHAAWNGVQHSLTISGLDAMGIGLAAWKWVTSFVWQQLIYHGIAKNGALPAPKP